MIHDEFCKKCETESVGDLKFRPKSQGPCVVVNVIPHEGGDEIVGVVVQWLHADLHWISNISTGSRKVCRFELVVKEPISCSLVYENSRLRTRISLHKFSSIILLSSSHRPEITSESLFSPGDGSRITDRSKGRNRGEHAWIF